MTHPGPCLRCSLPWRRFGPYDRYECDNEHVYQRGADGSMTEVVYPDFTDDQIREVEVELYRERRVKAIPDRRAALEELRRRHDADAMWAHTSGVNP